MISRLVVLGFVISFILVGCTPEIRVNKDPYKNATIVLLDIDHSVKMENPGKYAYSFGSQYAKEIKNGISSPVTLILMLHVANNMSGLTNEIYLKVDDKIQKYPLLETNSQEKTTVVQQQTQSQPGNNTSTRLVTVRSNTLSGKLTFTKDLENSILNSKEVSYRVYSGNDSIELTVSESQLARVKEFLKHDGQEKSR